LVRVGTTRGIAIQNYYIHQSGKEWTVTAEIANTGTSTPTYEVWGEVRLVNSAEKLVVRRESLLTGASGRLKMGEYYGVGGTISPDGKWDTLELMPYEALYTWDVTVPGLVVTNLVVSVDKVTGVVRNNTSSKVSNVEVSVWGYDKDGRVVVVGEPWPEVFELDPGFASSFSGTLWYGNAAFAVRYESRVVGRAP
jgi:hypothetical protein